MDINFGRPFWTLILDVICGRHLWTSVVDVNFGHHLWMSPVDVDFWKSLLDIFSTACMMKPLHALLPGELDGITSEQTEEHCDLFLFRMVA